MPRARTEPASGLLKAFGQVLKAARQEVGLSQEKLAHSSDLDPTYVSQLERGLKWPSLRAIAALAANLGMPAWELVRRAERGSTTDDST